MHGCASVRCLVVAVLASGIAPAQRGITAVWANDGADKVTQDELRVSDRGENVRNSVWDGHTVRVAGARNEVVSFNLVLEAKSGDANRVGVKFERLATPSGFAIESQAATGDQVFAFVRRNIELFFVRYLPIRGLSLVSYGTYDERHVPRRLQRPWTGQGDGRGKWQDRPDHDKMYPEIAVPLEVICRNPQNSACASPDDMRFNISAGQNQSVWVDIYIPPDAPPGVYDGEVLIQQNGGPNITVPVQLAVHNFSLPDEPTAKTMLYFSSSNLNRRYFGQRYLDPNSTNGVQARQIRDRHFQIAHRHRISLIGDDVDDCNNTFDRPCPEWVPRLNGSLFSPVNNYEGPGLGIGNNVYSIGTYGTWPWRGQDQNAMNVHTDAWANWFAANSPGTEHFLYLIDESNNYAETEMWAKWIATNPGPGRNVRSMATIPLPSAAASTPSLDIPASTIWQGIFDDWEPLTKQYSADPRKGFYAYNGHRPGSGTFATEDDGVALRELAWVQHKKNIDRWFFWESTYYTNTQGNTGETNVFTNAQTFGHFEKTHEELGKTGSNYGNGDGVLFYPGTDRVFPEETYGLKGPLVSLRMKHWRRGLQDVEYLKLAAAVNPAAVETLVNSMVPKALWEYGVTDPSNPTWVRSDISWPVDPDSWEAARTRLASAIGGQVSRARTLFLQNEGNNAVSGWSMGGPEGRVIQSSPVILTAAPGWNAKAAGDFDANGWTDIVLQNSATWQVSIWFKGGAHGLTVLSAPIIHTAAANWHVVAAGDFDRNGSIDLVLQNRSTNPTLANAVSIWYFGGPAGTTLLSAPIVHQALPGWNVVAAGDLDRSGTPDLVLQSTGSNAVSVWYMGGANGGTLLSAPIILTARPGWRVLGTTDLNVDGIPDIVLQNEATYQVSVWYMGGPQGSMVISSPIIATAIPGWRMLTAR